MKIEQSGKITMIIGTMGELRKLADGLDANVTLSEIRDTGVTTVHLSDCTIMIKNISAEEAIRNKKRAQRDIRRK